MLRIVVFFLSFIFISSCTKESLTINDDSVDLPGGAAVEEEVWLHDKSIDTAISTMSGKELMNHLKGLSDYVDGVNKKVHKREVKVIETLPSIKPEIKRDEEMSFYREYLKKNHLVGEGDKTISHTRLPFQELSQMAIRIQLTTMKIEARDSSEYHEDRP